MRFSIIVPFYNVHEYIGECLESLVKQSYEDFEIVMIDDGSSDGSSEIALSYAEKDSRIRVIQQINGGVSKARNVGLGVAVGEYITFVDSDDYVSADYLERIDEAIQRFGADIVVFSGDSFPPSQLADEQLVTKKVTYVHNSVEALMVERGSRPYMCNKAYRRTLIEKNSVHFFEELVLGEDQVFQFQTFPFANTISYIPDKIYHYRQDREGSAMNRFLMDSDSMFVAHIDLVRCTKQWWEDRGIMEANRSTWANWAIPFLYRYLKAASKQCGEENISSITGILDDHLVEAASDDNRRLYLDMKASAA